MSSNERMSHIMMLTHTCVTSVWILLSNFFFLYANLVSISVVLLSLPSLNKVCHIPRQKGVDFDPQ